MATTTTTLNATCHCKRASFTIPLSSTAFPLPSAFCSCSSCRYSTGQLAASFALIPTPKDDLPLDVSILTRYDSSQQRSRYFCRNCGANVVDLADNLWRVCTGTLEQTEGLLRRNLIFLGDTKDGGLSVWMNHIDRKFMAGSGSDEFDDSSQSRVLSHISSNDALTDITHLDAMCHCGGVRFQILRPDAPEARYNAGIDTCTNCRTSTGFELTFWASVPLGKVQMPDWSPMNLSAASTPLKSYTSSPGVSRHFCGTCGATVFVAKKDQGWIDVAAGLLRAEEGARAERWLEWKEIGFPEQATDRSLVKNLQRDFRNWKQVI